MLIHASKSGRGVSQIPGEAHIVISIQADGRLGLCAYRRGEFNAVYAAGDERQTLARVPRLLQELQEELQRFNF